MTVLFMCGRWERGNQFWVQKKTAIYEGYIHSLTSVYEDHIVGEVMKSIYIYFSINITNKY